MNPTTTHQRTQKLINPALQLRLVGVFVAVSALGFLLQALLLGSQLTALAETLPTGGNAVLGRVPSILVETLTFSFLLLLPVTIAVGVLATFRIAGPLYRVEQHLHRIVRGESVGNCKIRQGDQLQDFVDLLNEAVDTLRSESETPAEVPEPEAARDLAA